MGKLVRMIDEEGTLSVIAADSTDIVREMRSIHGTSKVCSAALGRMLTAATMMGSTLKGKDDSITVKITAAVRAARFWRFRTPTAMSEAA